MIVKSKKNNRNKEETKTPSRHRATNVPPRNPNKRPTHINLERSIGRMKAEDREIIRQAR
ncbi:hypothetical protein [Bacillus sp. 2205SS5-2]|uniref:hypothetical protein n=1 Tax=Bacillus sp. 2205SS5-2 TaxID=3109031 RepID=UPI0030072A53